MEPVLSSAARQAERTGSVANVSVDETPWNTQNDVDAGTSSLVGSSTQCARGGLRDQALAAPTRWVGFSLNRWVVLSIYFLCAIRGDPHPCGWDDCTGRHRWQTRSRRLNPGLAAARPPGRVTATAAMGVRFLVFVAQCGRANRTGTIRAILHLTTI